MKAPTTASCLGRWAWLALLLGACVSGPNAKDVRQSEIQYDMGVNDLKAGQLTDALQNFMEAVKLNPRFPQAHNGLGLVQYMLQNYAEAVVHLNKALELKPDYSEVMNTLARIYIAQGQFHEAIPLLRKALDDVFLPERYLAESNLGWALFQVGEADEGFRRVKNSLAENDHYCVGYEYLGLMHQAQKNFSEAAEQFRKVNEYCPKYAQGFLDLGKVLLMAGDEKGGCEALQTCRTEGGMSLPGQDCDRIFRQACKAPAGAPSGG